MAGWSKLFENGFWKKFPPDHLRVLTLFSSGENTGHAQSKAMELIHKADEGTPSRLPLLQQRAIHEGTAAAKFELAKSQLTNFHHACM